jgi:hypothetical protein
VTSLYPQKLALTSPTGGGRSVGIVLSRTKAMEFILEYLITDKVNLSDKTSVICKSSSSEFTYKRCLTQKCVDMFTDHAVI